jgi:hypothetical protein
MHWTVPRGRTAEIGRFGNNRQKSSQEIKPEKRLRRASGVRFSELYNIKEGREFLEQNFSRREIIIALQGIAAGHELSSKCCGA